MLNHVHHHQKFQGVPPPGVSNTSFGLFSLSYFISFYTSRSHISLSWFSCGFTILVEFEFGELVVFFFEGEKPENLEKNPRNKARTKHKLNPHHGTGRN